ncbi:hypothetical protein AB1E18_004951 [Capra hircus]
MRVWKTGHRKEKGNFPGLLLSQKNSVPKWTSPGGLTQLKTDPQCSKGTCRTEVEAGYCRGSPRSCWTRHRRENGWGAAALRAPGSAWKGLWMAPRRS